MQDVSPAETFELGLDSLSPQQIEPDIWRIPVPLPTAVHTANVYLLRGDGHGGGTNEGWCLIDAPLGTARAEATFQAGLAAAGISPADVHAIVLTHGHPDHMGAVGRWQQRAGAPVYLLGLEAHLVTEVWGEATQSAMYEAARSLTRHGMPGDEAQRLVTQAVQLRGTLVPPDHMMLLSHGQHVHLAGGHYHVIWTPGHTNGHLCLLREDGVLIAGDHVLAGLAPTVGWYPWSRPDPIADHDRSLAALADLHVRLVLPGHGRAFTDLRKRTEELRGLHARQTVAIARLLAEQPTGLTAYELAGRIYPNRWRWTDTRRLAVAETVALLEHLRLLGRAERGEREDGLVVYRRSAESNSSAVTWPDEPPSEQRTA
jgi:glyoxylase-like metal-dependent hydrolase (beta-lactamase superfamily II)